MTDEGEGTESTRDRRISRLLDGSEATRSDPKKVLYQHSVLAQTGLPYRNPGDDVLSWERTNGKVGLEVLAGKAWHPDQGFMQVGLPYGPKPRLILAHLNSVAVRFQCREIEVEHSLTAFVKRLQLDPGGRTIGTIKDQLTRLAASTVRLGITHDGKARTVNTQIVSSFDLWLPREESGRVLWPTTVTLSHEYFESLAKHAIPLHDKALMALSGSAMALDVYAWLAQRLHRIEWGERVFLTWAALKAQFGWNYDRMCDFKVVFRRTLRDVHSQYRAADVELDGQGMTLRRSPPPVKGRTGIVVKVP